MYGASRIITGVARDHLIPPVLARVGRFRTPWIAIVMQGVATAILALLSPFSELADMVSISTLFAFWVVALGMIWRRSCTDGAGGAASRGAAASKDATAAPPPSMLRRRLLTAALLFLINAGALVVTLGLKLPAPGSTAEKAMLGAGLAVFLAAAAALHVFVKPSYTPPRYNAPLYPWLPALSMGFNIFLLGQLGEAAYVRFGIWTAACVGCYLLYSAAASWNKAEHDRTQLPTNVPATQLTDDGAKDAGGLELAPAGRS
jgi:APA family basic amino acid/polyamine antiporter